MSDESGRSVTGWITSLKEGDSDAAQKLWQRYFEALVCSRTMRLRGAQGRSRRGGCGAQPHSTAFAAALRQPLSTARRPRRSVATASRHHRRKAIDQARRQGRLKRGGRRILGTSEFADCDLVGRGIAGVRCTGADPRVRCDGGRRVPRRARAVRDGSLRNVARLRMEGYPTRRSPNGSGVACGASRESSNWSAGAGSAKGERVMSDCETTEPAALPLDVLDRIDRACDRLLATWEGGAGPSSRTTSVRSPPSIARHCSATCSRQKSTPASAAASGRNVGNTATAPPAMPS